MSYLVTDVQDQPVSVLFSLDLVGHLKNVAGRGFIGRDGRFRAVLFGTIDSTGGARTLVTVESLEPAPGLSPVGIVRGWLRGRVYLGKEDRAVIGARAAQPYSVLLVIRPVSFGIPVAGAFLCKSGQVTSENSFAEFPLHRGRIASGGFTIFKHAAGPDAAIVRQPVPRRARIRIPAWAWVPVGMAMLAVLAAGLQHGDLRSYLLKAARPANPPRISLNLQRTGNDLLVRWDPENAAIRTAEKAMLHVVDGGTRRSVTLDPSQLQVGAAQYHPASNDVEFRLEIPGSNKSDPIRFISGVPREDNGSPEAPDARPKQFAPAEQLAELPGEAGQKGESVRSELHKAGRLRPDRPTVQISYEPLPPSALRKALRKMRGMTLLRFKNSAEYVAAHAVNEVMPVVPPATARKIAGERRFQLRATIDKNGRLTDVRPASSGADKALVVLVEDAIRKWQFKPARIHNRLVPSSARFLVHYENPAAADVSARR